MIYLCLGSHIFHHLTSHFTKDLAQIWTQCTPTQWGLSKGAKTMVVEGSQVWEIH